MKRAAFILLLLTLNAQAVIPVSDYTLIINTQVNHIQDYLKQLEQYILQGEQYVQEKLTALRELQQVENEILELERMGDPKAYGMSIPGISNIQTLALIYQQAERDYQDISAMVNPNSLKMTWQQIQGLYGQNQFNGFSSNGWKAAPATSLINFYTIDYNVAYTTQQRIQQLIQQKTIMTKQRDALLSEIQGAADQSKVQKQNAALSALNSAITNIDASIAQEKHTADLQFQQNQSAQRISQNIQQQQTMAHDLQVIDAGQGSLPLGSFNQPVLWGNQ